jgi:hypothetical protein
MTHAEHRSPNPIFRRKIAAPARSRAFVAAIRRALVNTAQVDRA